MDVFESVPLPLPTVDQEPELLVPEPLVALGLNVAVVLQPQVVLFPPDWLMLPLAVPFAFTRR